MTIPEEDPVRMSARRMAMEQLMSQGEEVSIQTTGAPSSNSSGSSRFVEFGNKGLPNDRMSETGGELL